MIASDATYIQYCRKSEAGTAQSMGTGIRRELDKKLTKYRQRLRGYSLTLASVT
ncbi:MAG: hypothetical protein QXN69_02795 [Candidatus Methanomethylicaceae archaeon]